MAEDQMLTPGDIMQAHNCPGGDAWLIANGYGDHLGKYLSSVEQGITWDPMDMSGVPPTPVASTLAQGMRNTTDVNLPDDEDLPPYEEWSKVDLVAEAEARGIDKSGTKDDLAMRLMEYDETHPAESPEPPVAVDYDAFKRGELVQILQQRGLSTVGKNDELIARLQEDDAKRQNG